MNRRAHLNGESLTMHVYAYNSPPAPVYLLSSGADIFYGSHRKAETPWISKVEPVGRYWAGK